MSAVLDFTQPALSVLLAQINYDNNTTYTPDQIRVEQVASLPAGNQYGLNSIVFIAATQGAQLEGQDFFRYNRIDISTVPGERTTQFTLGSALYLSDLLSQINTIWSLNLTAADIVDGLLPASIDGNPVSLIMQITAGSLLWLNQVEISVQ
jgi:hypothetical protein